MGSDTAARQHVINIALQQAYDGAHYMWGSRGGRPNDNSVSTRFNPKNVTDMSRLSFCAAFTDRDGGAQVCGGRWMRRAVPEGTRNPTTASDPKLQAWLAANGHKSEINWDSSLTPRLTKGVGVKTQIVWGEGCDDTRHFDCIAFVNWCLGKGNLSKFTFDMYQYFYSIEPRNGVISAKDVTDEAVDKSQPADILLYGTIVGSPATYFEGQIAEERAHGKTKDADLDQIDLDAIRNDSPQNFKARHSIPCIPKYGVGVGIHHIGFATGKNNGRVHASENAMGVISDTWGDPVRRIRLPSSFFV
ncbi:hypothetical protein BH11PSE4_BH11PSE4_05390 [soil metagenome]